MARTFTNNFEVQRKRVMQKVNLEIDKANRAIANIVQKAGEMVLEEAIPITPIETGALRESGRVFVGTKKISEKGFQVTATVSFGGNVQVTPTKNAPSGVVDYAVYVHEDLSKYHPIGQAKFLEEGTRRAQPRINQFMEQQLAILRNSQT